MKNILEYYFQEQIDEIISRKSINRFEESNEIKSSQSSNINNDNRNNNVEVTSVKITNNEVVNKEVVKNKILTENKVLKDNFIKPVFSTSQAVSNLAKRFQNDNFMNDQSYQSLNEIIKKAQDLAKTANNTKELKKIVEDFDGCNLKKMASNTVFCDGNPNSKIMVIGEAPGNQEDLKAIPFCGDSGIMLDAMFKAINMKRSEDYYITNVIFWRPPGNRRPTDEELAICRPFVERHIELVGPKVIILVGATSMSAILGSSDPISKIRGRFNDYAPDFLKSPCKSFVIFHPSYLMRQPMKKKIAWQDMLKLEQFILNNYN